MVLGFYLLNRGLQPLGSLLAGALAAWLGGPWAITIMGGSCIILVIIMAAAVPEVWRLKLRPKMSGASGEYSAS